jgi:hypothetical protein
MSHIQRKAVFALTVALLALLSSTALAFAQSGVWAVISSPNQGTKDNQLLGVAAVSTSDTWSVGNYNAGPYTNSLRTLAQHWNGSSWSIVSTANAAKGTGDYDSLQGVATVSTSNVWAVGYSGNGSVAADKTLIEHWNGSAWSIASSPNPYATQDLYGVAAVSTSDIWAVGGGFSDSPYTSKTLIEHWNGTRWAHVSSPGYGDLYGVTAVASNNVWAVGQSQVLHWNGTSWSIVSSPQPLNGNGYQLTAVAAVSASNIWAAGYQEIASGEGYMYDPLIEHWDGSSWKLASGTNPNIGTTFLFGVTAISPTSAWAVGVTLGLSFVEKWNGTQWARVSSPNVGTSNNTFQAVAAVPTTGDVWAVGEDFSTATSSYRTLVERCMAC